MGAWATAALGLMFIGLGFFALAPVRARLKAVISAGWRYRVQLQLRSDWLPVGHSWQWQGAIHLVGPFGPTSQARPRRPQPSPMAKILALLRLAQARSWASWVQVGEGEPAHTAWLAGLIWAVGAALAALAMPDPPAECCAVVCPDWNGGGVQAEVQAEFGFAGWRLLKAWGVALGWAAAAAWSQWAPGEDAPRARRTARAPAPSGGEQGPVRRL